MDYEKDQDVSDSGMYEIQSSEPPRYEHYQMHRNSGRMEQKSPVKPKKKNNPGKKIAGGCCHYFRKCSGNSKLFWYLRVQYLWNCGAVFQ